MRFNHRDKEILHLAIPSIISNITVPLLGLVDLAIVGHISNETLIAAISVGSMILMLSIGFSVFFAWEQVD